MAEPVLNPADIGIVRQGIGGGRRAQRASASSILRLATQIADIGVLEIFDRFRRASWINGLFVAKNMVEIR